MHAVADALLGAAALGDIGEHFPDTDPRYRGIASSALLRSVIDELSGLGMAVAQVDCSILAERPRLAAHKEEIRASLRRMLSLPADRVAVKARTGEGLDAVGRGEAIAVHCIAVLTEHFR
jgi:2-C-methyl-D-erythritol 2,4-cyclodiphosphate synthase